MYLDVLVKIKNFEIIVGNGSLPTPEQGSEGLTSKKSILTRSEIKTLLGRQVAFFMM